MKEDKIIKALDKINSSLVLISVVLTVMLGVMLVFCVGGFR